MEIRRTLAAGAIGLAFVAGGVGCGKAADKVAERSVEEALERSGDCENVDIDADGGVSGECGGESIDVDASGDAELPDGWPEGLAPPEGANIVFSSETGGSLSVVAGIDGEVGAVADGITAQLEEAGYTIEDESSADSGGIQSATIRATGDEYEALIAVTDATNAANERGNITVNYTLTPSTGS